MSPSLDGIVTAMVERIMAQAQRRSYPQHRRSPRVYNKSLKDTSRTVPTVALPTGPYPDETWYAPEEDEAEVPLIGEAILIYQKEHLPFPIFPAILSEVLPICYLSSRKREGHVMTRFIGCIVALVLFNVAEVQAQGYIDGLMDRATQSATRKAQDRVNQNIEQSIDKAIKKTEETVKCVATDQECLKRAKEDGKQVQTVGAPAASDTMKCLVTDTGCMKEAKAHRKKVEIVEEHQLDTLRCSMTDTNCLTRAKAMGKKVDIID